MIKRFKRSKWQHIQKISKNVQKNYCISRSIEKKTILELKFVWESVNFISCLLSFLDSFLKSCINWNQFLIEIENDVTFLGKQKFIADQNF